MCAVKNLNSANVIHRDLKPANILINRDCQIQLCDFGLARTLPESSTSSGSGNTKRIRNQVKKRKLDARFDKHRERRLIAKKLLSDQEKKGTHKSKKRSLSSHVGSRWYRAPEISLVEPRYDQASDMWSLGCILYELLKATQTAPEDIHEVVAFPGTSCYPLSPNGLSPDADAPATATTDQLTVTLQKLDDLNDDDLSFITEKEVKSYI